MNRRAFVAGLGAALLTARAFLSPFQREPLVAPAGIPDDRLRVEWLNNEMIPMRFLGSDRVFMSPPSSVVSLDDRQTHYTFVDRTGDAAKVVTVPNTPFLLPPLVTRSGRVIHGKEDL